MFRWRQIRFEKTNAFYTLHEPQLKYDLPRPPEFAGIAVVTFIELPRLLPIVSCLLAPGLCYLSRSAGVAEWQTLRT